MNFWTIGNEVGHYRSPNRQRVGNSVSCKRDWIDIYYALDLTQRMTQAQSRFRLRDWPDVTSFVNSNNNVTVIRVKHNSPNPRIKVWFAMHVSCYFVQKEDWKKWSWRKQDRKGEIRKERISDITLSMQSYILAKREHETFLLLFCFCFFNTVTHTLPRCRIVKDKYV